MANAAPRNTKATTERSEKKTFVFGSSTPRDLSYMHTVPATLRTYDSKVKPKPRAKDETLAHYMRQARSVTRNQSGSREASGDRVVRSTFAFGSSTPRILSHLYNANRDYSDGRINPQVGRRSYTTPTIPTNRSSTVPATTVKIHEKRTTNVTRKPTGKERKKITSTTARHAVSAMNHQPKQGSEEFMNSVKQKLEAQKEARKDTTKSPVKKVPPKKKEPKIAEKPTEGKKVPVDAETAKTEPAKKPEEKQAPHPESAKIGNVGKEETSPIAAKRESEEQKLLESSVAEDEAKLLSVEAAPPQNIVPQEIPEDDDMTKAMRVESLKDSKLIQVLDEVPEAKADDEITKSYHLGSIGDDGIKNSFLIISKEEHPIDEGAEKESKDEAEGKDSENYGPDKSETLFGEHHSTVPLSVTSDPEISVVQQRSPPPSPSGTETAASVAPVNSSKATFGSPDDGHEQEELGKAAKDQVAVPEGEHAVPEPNQHRFLEADETAAPEKPRRSLQEQPDAPTSGTIGQQIIYNYSYEYRTGEPEESEESMHIVTQESPHQSRSESNASSEHPGDSQLSPEQRKKSKDGIESVSVL